MLQSLAAALTLWSTRWVPDAWVIAVILTIVTYALGLFFTKSTLFQLVQFWGNGFWLLLSFAMQMCLIIMTGYIFATTPFMSRLLDRLARIPNNPKSAIALMALVSLVLGWVQWGLSLVGSAVFVRYLVRHQKGVDYRLLVATAYLGLGAIFHAGLSGSAPLLIATPKHFIEQYTGVIPITKTTFHPFNLILAAVVLLTLPAFGPLMHPRREETVEVDPRLFQEASPAPSTKPSRKETTPARWIEHSPLINLLVGLGGLTWLVWHFGQAWDGGFRGILAKVNLDVVNFFFLMAGVLLHRTPASFLQAAREAGTFIWGVAIQFPFYAGMFGIIRDSGLAQVIAHGFTTIATKNTYPFIVLWYSGILNYIVPSGGSKFAIEAPYIIQAAKELGVGIPMTIIAYAWGDMTTNIIQPFWAIPLLGIAKLEFRDIMGYCILYFIFYMILVSAAFLLMPLVFTV